MRKLTLWGMLGLFLLSVFSLFTPIMSRGEHRVMVLNLGEFSPFGVVCIAVPLLFFFVAISGWNRSQKQGAYSLGFLLNAVGFAEGYKGIRDWLISGSDGVLCIHYGFVLFLFATLVMALWGLFFDGVEQETTDSVHTSRLIRISFTNTMGKGCEYENAGQTNGDFRGIHCGARLHRARYRQKLRHF